MNLSKAVDNIISETPFLEEALSDGLINTSSLARKIHPEVEKKLQKKVNINAIIMAISRRPCKKHLLENKDIRQFIDDLGDIIVRSDLIECTFENSVNLYECNRQLMAELSHESNNFFSISQGVYETTLVVSRNLSNKIEKIYSGEKKVFEQDMLSSITIKLPENNTRIYGIYYFLLKNLAWAGINICEVISTSNEITFVVKEKDVHRAFSILMKTKRS